MRLFVTYPCQPPGGVTKAERSLFGMAPATPHPRLDLDQPLLSPKRCGASSCVPVPAFTNQLDIRGKLLQQLIGGECI